MFQILKFSQFGPVRIIPRPIQEDKSLPKGLYFIFFQTFCVSFQNPSDVFQELRFSRDTVELTSSWISVTVNTRRKKRIKPYREEAVSSDDRKQFST